MFISNSFAFGLGMDARRLVFFERMWYGFIMELLLAGKECELFLDPDKNASLVVLPTFKRDGEEVFRLVKKETDKPFSLLTVRSFDWNDALTPWKAEAIFRNDKDYGGKADGFLQELTDVILPQVKGKADISPANVALCGYSLGGLFALYAGFRTDVFDALVSASGSFWYDGFVGFAEKTPFSRNVRYVYLSLGDKESKTRHPIMRTAEEKTQEIYRILREKGVNVTFTFNEGGHFDQPNARLAQGVAAFLQR